MISELPKLFDKNFAIAYFLPSAGFVTIADYVFSRLAKTAPLVNFSNETIFKDLTAFAVAALILAVILSLVSRYIVRLMEGYWSFTLFRRQFDFRPYLNFLEVRYFDKLSKRQEKLNAKSLDGSISAKEDIELSDIGEKLAYRFPLTRDLVLPTSFGNTYRAFENYANEMYGVEAIDGWFRLMAIIPKDYLGLVNDARARLDFGVNLWFLSFVLLIEYVTLAAVYIRVANFRSFFTGETLWWFPLAALAFACFSYIYARNAVGLWGNWVKTAFDLYLPELRRKLEFKQPASAAEEKAMWEQFNAAIVFRRQDLLPERERKAAETPPKCSRKLARKRFF